MPPEKSGLDRRSLAASLTALAAGTLLPLTALSDAAPSGAADVLDAAAAAALAVSPASLSPEQRLDVRNGVRSLHQALVDARKAPLEYAEGPAFVFLPEGRR